LCRESMTIAYQRAIELRDEFWLHILSIRLMTPKVIAGQGTIGLEILDEMPDVEAVIVPVGGGGLISGVAMAIKELRPEVKVYGVQSTGAPSMANFVERW